MARIVAAPAHPGGHCVIPPPPPVPPPPPLPHGHGPAAFPTAFPSFPAFPHCSAPPVPPPPPAPPHHVQQAVRHTPPPHPAARPSPVHPQAVLPAPLPTASVYAVTVPPKVVLDTAAAAPAGSPEATFVFVAVTLPAVISAAAGFINHSFGRHR